MQVVNVDDLGISFGDNLDESAPVGCQALQAQTQLMESNTLCEQLGTFQVECARGTSSRTSMGGWQNL